MTPASELIKPFKSKAIYLTDGEVIRDTDAVQMYRISLHRLRGLLRKHPGRFPEDFAIKTEMDTYLFTLEGLLQIATLLKTPQAISIHIEVVRELFAHRYN